MELGRSDGRNWILSTDLQLAWEVLDCKLLADDGCAESVGLLYSSSSVSNFVPCRCSTAGYGLSVNCVSTSPNFLRPSDGFQTLHLAFQRHSPMSPYAGCLLHPFFDVVTNSDFCLGKTEEVMWLTLSDTLVFDGIRLISRFFVWSTADLAP